MSITGNGVHRRSRKRLSRRAADKGKIDLKRALQAFNAGDRVLIDPNPSIQRNIPNRKFFGYNGVVVVKKGKAYTISVPDGRKSKMLDILPVHLRKA